MADDRIRTPLRRPRRPARGATARVVAPCSPFDRDRFLSGLERLAELGVVPVYSDRVFQADGFLAGPDALRAAELASALSDDCAIVITARGGYGSMRLLRDLARHAASFAPTLFCGFSDLTAVHLFLLGTGRISLHGPNVTTIPQLDAPSLARLGAALTGVDPEQTFDYAGLTPVRGGRAEGTLVAGNLSMICALAGTPFSAPLAGSVLVIEDTAEAPYRIDRMLTQLAMQADSARIAAVAFGDLGTRPEDEGLVRRSVEHFAAQLRCPVVTGFPVGHGAVNYPVPVGVRASLDADVGLLRVLEDPFEP